MAWIDASSFNSMKTRIKCCGAVAAQYKKEKALSTRHFPQRIHSCLATMTRSKQIKRIRRKMGRGKKAVPKLSPPRRSLRLAVKGIKIPSVSVTCKASYTSCVRRRQLFNRVPRTVEMVNQKDGKWREPKSKLLFILALGLTPNFQNLPSSKLLLRGVPDLQPKVSRLHL